MGFGFDLGAVAGSVISGAFGSNQADKNRDLQKYFARNAHQIEVEDLKKAGLNPVLSAGGSGAHSVGGSTASTPDFGSAMSMSSGADVAIKKATVENLKTQNDLLRAQTVKTAAETRATAEDTRILSARADKEEITKRPFKWLAGAASSAEDRFKEIAKRPFDAEFPNPVGWLMKKYKER